MLLQIAYSWKNGEESFSKLLTANNSGKKILALLLILYLFGTKANDSYEAFSVGMVADNYGKDVGGQFNPYIYISLDSCKELCNANIQCNSFLYNTYDNCALKDLCLTGTEPTNNVGYSYRTYYRLECRGQHSPEPLHTPITKPKHTTTSQPNYSPKPSLKSLQQPSTGPSNRPTKSINSSNIRRRFY